MIQAPELRVLDEYSLMAGRRSDGAASALFSKKTVVCRVSLARQGIAQQCPERDDRRVLSSIIFINLNDLRWCYARKEYGPYKTLYNRWSDKGIRADHDGACSRGAR